MPRHPDARRQLAAALAAAALLASASARAQPPTEAEAAKRYAWPRIAAGYAPLAGRFAPPAGFTRDPVAAGSYEEWLRHLPLRPAGTPVRSYSGAVLDWATRAAAAVVDLDVGTRDLQQCMDTLIRLRAEWHWSRGQGHLARFRYAGGRYFGWADWRQGIRPRTEGGRTTFAKTAGADWSRAGFGRYLAFVFMMTGTMHNTAEPAVAFADLRAGDFFVQPPPSPGALGHTVVVLDLARDARGQRRAILGEGFTPAMDLHVLKAPGGGVWYALDGKADVQTPLWTTPFRFSDLRRFRY